MKYKRIHDEIIENRKNHPLKKTSGKTETHHIIPKSLGGLDTTENLIELLSREHFIVHYLLWKMYPKDSKARSKMVKAFTMMKASPADKSRYFNSRLYAAAQIEKSKAMSIAQGGERNSQYGTMWIYSMTEKKNRRIKKSDPIPEGWKAGRNLNGFKSRPGYEFFDCVVCGKEFERQVYKTVYRRTKTCCAKHAHELRAQNYKNQYGESMRD